MIAAEAAWRTVLQQQTLAQHEPASPHQVVGGGRARESLENSVRLLEQLDKAKAEWEAETKTKRYTVDEDNVAEVVAMMTGIPVLCARPAQTPFHSA